MIIKRCIFGHFLFFFRKTLNIRNPFLDCLSCHNSWVTRLFCLNLIEVNLTLYIRFNLKVWRSFWNPTCHNNRFLVNVSPLEGDTIFLRLSVVNECFRPYGVAGRGRRTSSNKDDVRRTLTSMSRNPRKLNWKSGR